MKDLIKYTLNHMKRKFMRNMLTVLSILIGISAIFALMSYGSGLKKYTDDIFQEMGTDKILIQMKSIGPLGSSQTYFTEEQYRFFEKRNEILELGGMVINTGEIKSGEKELPGRVYIAGIPGGKERDLITETLTYKIIYGREIKKGDSYKAVLGYNYLIDNKIFKNALKLGDKILINNQYFDIVGFHDEIGNPDDDSQIIIELDIAREILDKEGYDMIVARVKSNINITEATDKIKESFRKYLNQEKGQETFFIQTFEELIEQYSSIIGVLNAVLVLIAGISVLVASINIVNTMYTSVYERTKEIGILKAIGAKNSDIIFIFTFEAGLIGFLGGLFGVIIGYIISATGGKILIAVGYSFLQPYFSINLVIGCILLATIVGTIAGIFPARNAAKMSPVNSLRYE